MSVDEGLIADLEAQLAALKAQHEGLYTEKQRHISGLEWERHAAKVEAKSWKAGYDPDEWRGAIIDSYDYRALTLSRSLKLARMGLPIEAEVVMEVVIKGIDPLSKGALGILIIINFYDALTKATIFDEKCDFYDAIFIPTESDLVRCFVAPKRAIREWKQMRENTALPPPFLTFGTSEAHAEYREQFKAGRRWQKAQAAERAAQAPQLPAPHQANSLPATLPAPGSPTVEGFLDTIDPDNLTPKQAQDVLYELKRLRGEQRRQ